MPNKEQLSFGVLGIGIGVVITSIAFAIIFLPRGPEMDASRMGTLLFLNPESNFTYVAMSCIDRHNDRSVGENIRLAVPYRLERRRDLGLYVDRSDPEYESPGIETLPDRIPVMIVAMRQIQNELREEFGCVSAVVGRPLE